ncbi:sufR family transcriptional regulator [Mycobacterium kansasii]|uniref:SufR family transcriptional regulator n=1 Tax=Mycobacterium kansasii TaxID=1768 RepID=A0A1V3XW02_MYCKA|nr:sufR family transcriptional regulator [Mycobacterium kansasii]
MARGTIGCSPKSFPTALPPNLIHKRRRWPPDAPGGSGWKHRQPTATPRSRSSTWWGARPAGVRPERRVSDGQHQLGLRHCPFLEVAESRSAIVCPIHLGLMQGALESWAAPVGVERLDVFAEPDLCLAHLSLKGAAR